MLQRFESFVTGITVCYKYIQKIKTMEMTEFGLRGAQVMCLFFLHHSSEELTAAQLCQLCSEDKAAISRTLVTLQEKGYIESDEKRYRSHLKLTDSGRDIAQRIDAIIEQWVAAIGDGLTDQERIVFHHALEVVSGNLRGSIEKIYKINMNRKEPLWLYNLLSTPHLIFCRHRQRNWD